MKKTIYALIGLITMFTAYGYQIGDVVDLPSFSNSYFPIDSDGTIGTRLCWYTVNGGEINKLFVNYTVNEDNSTITINCPPKYTKFVATTSRIEVRSMIRYDLSNRAWDTWTQSPLILEVEAKEPDNRLDIFERVMGFMWTTYIR